MPIHVNKLNIKLSTLVLLVCLALGQFIWLYCAYHIDPLVATADSLGSYFLMYGLILFIRYSPVFYIPKYIKYGIIEVPSLILAFLWVFFSKHILLELFGSNTAYVDAWDKTFIGRAVIGWLLLSTGIICHLILSELKKAEEAVKIQQQAEDLRKEAELFKLRQQLQPHFLFNSLNSINALINKQPKDARAMVQQLSDYLRNTLRKEDDHSVLLKEELQDLQLYLAIEKVRFGHRLNVNVDIQISNEQTKVPPFLIQPLVENAIKYGLYGTTGEVNINLIVKSHNGNLIFKISNPYDKDGVSVKGTGFGLESIKRRLYLLYARNDLLKIERLTLRHDERSEEIQLFVAILIIPMDYIKD
ncbi:Histidine kinase [Arachidicoccus rhizosphaerae]|jgi:sensor histidine kinase YesM|uniref:Histidine kinase n=1 Tax=Arachidicoccus rhizosphaerae TaxID=551991 RepID=A0A1H3VPS9_9BACT|nr:histidine kinase [Arachidicoccus rhizosphaerae]SDZ76825.1 Histidine kinase [Arachidicoccus rhizosphaerae]